MPWAQCWVGMLGDLAACPKYKEWLQHHYCQNEQGSIAAEGGILLSRPSTVCFYNPPPLSNAGAFFPSRDPTNVGTIFPSIITINTGECFPYCDTTDTGTIFSFSDTTQRRNIFSFQRLHQCWCIFSLLWRHWHKEHFFLVVTPQMQGHYFLSVSPLMSWHFFPFSDTTNIGTFFTFLLWFFFLIVISTTQGKFLLLVTPPETGTTWGGSRGQCDACFSTSYGYTSLMSPHNSEVHCTAVQGDMQGLAVSCGEMQYICILLLFTALSLYMPLRWLMFLQCRRTHPLYYVWISP